MYEFMYVTALVRYFLIERRKIYWINIFFLQKKEPYPPIWPRI